MHGSEFLQCTFAALPSYFAEHPFMFGWPELKAELGVILQALRSRKERAAMRRRDVLVSAGSLAVAASFPAPAITQGIRQLKLVTDWPADMPGLQTSAARIARTIEQASGGRIKVEVFPAGTFVRAFETFEAVGGGLVDMYHSFEGYFASKSPPPYFFSALPLRFSPHQLITSAPHPPRP